MGKLFLCVSSASKTLSCMIHILQLFACLPRWSTAGIVSELSLGERFPGGLFRSNRARKDTYQNGIWITPELSSSGTASRVQSHVLPESLPGGRPTVPDT